MQIPTVHEALKWASSCLEEHQCEPKVAEILLLHLLEWSKTDLLFQLRQQLPAEKWELFQQQIKQHAETKIPVQHLTGLEEFYGRTFYVNKDVLIPRPETEELIQDVINTVDNANHLTCVDIGTGSGIIAVTLAKEWERQQLKMLAVDLSPDALTVAKKNAAKHEAEVDFYQGSFLEPLIDCGQKVDIIVSNPPYIAYEEAEKLSDTVKHFDPEMALFAENDGLAAYQQILQQAPSVLKPNGMIFFEIGYTQGEAVTTIAKQYYPQSTVKVIQDINKKDRIVQIVT
ncbi:peptide chain release factor N(5)-glutamine methyltransferase [Gracilibacillus sp. S3-1-1]|uniref:Peptide chain release factor N(5)-glutamine methyltransferase n=1 Tax=Gracilibacillus pellucidus TaxID=3095368 RepID=A0ACC6MA19_9BACI|nr:peptide chain release factor N(5)-glutamine methyltransferase [Gracilibacillus sp. S3-1-1]MDX8047732.1 peptide chain release factor N(5)-glutamine methyltransferase [Gracilibacillus sp. S3-1-1]